MRQLKALAPAVFLGVLLISGCNKSEQTTSNLKAAATVNDQVVADGQIQAEMAKFGPIPPDQSQGLANQILKNDLDQELLAQEAVKNKLNDTPDVQWKLAAARRQILADAQVAVIAKDAAAPGADAIKTYFDGHPELFAQRKVYRLMNFVIDTTPQNIDKVRETMTKASDINVLLAKLKASGIAVSGQQAQKGSEELPKGLLDKLAGMKVGQSVTFDQGGRLNILVLMESHDAPLSLEQATPVISAYLQNDDKRKKVEAVLNKIRSQAKIEYQAPYAAVDSAAK